MPAAGVAKWAHRIFEAADWLAYRKIALATLEEEARELEEENNKLTAQRDRLEQELDAMKQVPPQTVLWQLRVRR